ncbi:MAG TPA: nucleotidyltransferase [Atribacterota bacterium]|nr:nucleotidyltransferase [Atribacterota bacterium]HOR42859.1 nucleotidyltransferase [Atribacterota bacterium]HPK86540.1 nucleotidyltransferase [Atribacterota bacterium]
MVTLGIIAEYNPFHNGHLYHLKKAKELSGAEYTIAVMGGNFLQRGEPAFWNKWIRTEMALAAGIDLIIELPFVFASQDARGFAQAGVRILDSLGVVDYITFGCENKEIEIFSQLAHLIRKEPPYFKKILKEELKKGLNFPEAREKAAISYYQKYKLSTEEVPLNVIKEILRQSNSILALEYIIALQSLKSSIKPLPIMRIGSDFLQDKWEGQFSSATAIRKLAYQYYYSLKTEILEKLKIGLPETSFQMIMNGLKQDVNPVTGASFGQCILAKLRSATILDLKNINGVEEGLENKLKNAADSSETIEELINATKSKRYTYTRVQRIMIHSLFNLTKKEVNFFNKSGPLYCRILGMTEKGRTILKKAKPVSKLPIVLKLKSFYKKSRTPGNKEILRMLDYDILATDLYVLAYHKKGLGKGKQDFSRKVILIQ